MATEKITAADIEIAVATWADYTRNIVVPNVFWGMGLTYEADLIILSRSGYGTEIEIKVSKSDLVRDHKKLNAHLGQNRKGENWVRKTFFAVPPSLKDEVRPDYGVLVVEGGHVEVYRPSPIKKDVTPLSMERRLKLAELGCMRIWTLKKKIAQLKENGDAKEKVV